MILASGPQAVTVRAGDDTNGDNEYSNDEIFMRKKIVQCLGRSV